MRSALLQLCYWWYILITHQETGDILYDGEFFARDPGRFAGTSRSHPQLWSSSAEWSTHLWYKHCMPSPYYGLPGSSIIHKGSYSPLHINPRLFVHGRTEASASTLTRTDLIILAWVRYYLDIEKLLDYLPRCRFSLLDSRSVRYSVSITIGTLLPLWLSITQCVTMGWESTSGKCHFLTSVQSFYW